MNDMTKTQADLEELFGRHQLMPVLRDTFDEISDDPFVVDVACQIYLHKQADVPTMVGLFSPKWGTPQEVAVMLAECVEDDILDFDMDSQRFIMRYEIDRDIEEMLARYQFPLPMVCPPKKVTSNKDGSGYFTQKGNIVLNGSNIFDYEDLCLDHINRCNSVPLTLNLDVIVSEQGEYLQPNKKDGENAEEYLKRCKQAHKFYDISKEVMEGLLVLGNEFWLTHKYDRRGRTYAVGYHVNSQGTDYNKAVLELSNKEVIT